MDPQIKIGRSRKIGYGRPNKENGHVSRMFGDDPDPMVTIARVGSGRSFRTRLRRWLVAVQRGSNGRTTNERLVSKGIMKARGDAATTS